MAKQHKNVIDGIVDYLFGVTAKNHSKPRPPAAYEHPMWVYSEEEDPEAADMASRMNPEQFNAAFPLGVLPRAKKDLDPEMQFIFEQSGITPEQAKEDSKHYLYGNHPAVDPAQLPEGFMLDDGPPDDPAEAPTEEQTKGAKETFEREGFGRGFKNEYTGNIG